MELGDLERRLERGERWGFKKETGDPNYLGWILVTKRKPPTIWSREAYDDDELYRELNEQAGQVREAPYHVLLIELRRDVHESGEYESNEDYRLRENHYLTTLDEVERMVGRFGYSLQNIRFSAELDAP